MNVKATRKIVRIDEDKCNGEEACLAGECVGGAQLVCADENPCTDDTCHPVHGCMYTPNSDPCSDGDPYTLDDFCQEGDCVGVLADIEVADETRLPEADPDFVDVQVDEGLIILEFTGPADQAGIAAGDILVGARGGGYLVFVDEVEFIGNEAFVSPSPAAITDAVLYGSFSSEIPAGYEDLVAEDMGRTASITISSNIGTDFSGTKLYQGNWGGADVLVEITSGGISFVPSITLEGDITWWGELEYFKAEISGTVNLWLHLLASISKNVSMGKKVTVFQTSKFFLGSIAGVVPVAGKVDFEVVAGFDLDVDASGTLTTGFDASAGITAGAWYWDTSWNPIWDKWVSASQQPLTWEVQGDIGLRGYVRPEFSVKLYGVAGPGIAVEPYLDLDGNFLPFPPCWDLDAGISGDLFFEAEILGYGFPPYNVPLFDYSIDVATGCIEPPCSDDCAGIICGHDECGDPCPDQCPDGKICNFASELCSCPTTCAQAGCGNHACDQYCGDCQQCTPNSTCCDEAGFWLSDATSCGGGAGQCYGHLCCYDHDHQACVGDDIYWYDSCNNQEGWKAACLPGDCSNGECLDACLGVTCPDCQVCDPDGGDCETDYSQNGDSCDPGDYCQNGSCLICASNYCQNHGYSSGAHCDGSTLVSCAIQGACFEVQSSTPCTYGCVGNACVGCGGFEEVCCGGSCDAGLLCSGGICVNDPGDPCGDGDCAPDENCFTCETDCACNPFLVEDFAGLTYGPATGNCQPKWGLDIIADVNIMVTIANGQLTLKNNQGSDIFGGIQQSTETMCNPMGLRVVGDFPAGTRFRFQKAISFSPWYTATGQEDEMTFVTDGSAGFGAILHFDDLPGDATLLIDSYELVCL